MGNFLSCCFEETYEKYTDLYPLKVKLYEFYCDAFCKKHKTFHLSLNNNEYDVNFLCDAYDGKAPYRGKDKSKGTIIISLTNRLNGQSSSFQRTYFPNIEYNEIDSIFEKLFNEVT
jgi:hypothetical protein